MRYRDLRGVLASSVAVMAVVVATPAVAQVRTFNVPAQAATTGIPALAKQADIQLLVASDAVSGKAIRAVKGRMTVDEAIRRIMDDAGLRVVNSDGRTYTLAPREAKRALVAALLSPAQAAQQAPEYDEIIVTAQKKEERIQDVPIAMSAFSAEALDNYKIEGGSELLRAIPNVTFSKSNFASYNFSIRGIGTKALAASTDPAVAISYNYSPLMRNRLFEQEYYDVERVEVLRGPQGTLYGRNATSGVVNMITMKPKLDEFNGYLKAEVGNYSSKRIGAMINVPVGDVFAVRVAGALTKRTGYDFNTVTNKNVNGRDLWSTRLGLLVDPGGSWSVNAAWERFEEDDDRSRTGKQLCTKDPGPEFVGQRNITNLLRVRGSLSQGCLPKSIYSDAAYDIPNAFALPYIVAAAGVVQLGNIPGTTTLVTLINNNVDPFDGIKVSKNLREISTTLDPRYIVKNDIFNLNGKFTLSNNLSLFSNLMYTTDNYNSFQDYNRYNSNAVFNNSKNLTDLFGAPNKTSGISVNGFLDDPQLGISDRILAADTVQSKSDQFNAEIRVASDFKSRFDFSVGANYTSFNIDESYYVFSNIFTAISRTVLGTGNNGNEVKICDNWNLSTDCTYTDPNKINNINGNGHNYFRSINKGSVKSKSLFGEVYIRPIDDFKVTLGLRYTNDRKRAQVFPSQLLLGTGIFGYGLINEGYFQDPDIAQKWNRLTGRLVVDWKPDLAFSETTLVYASYSRGYKGGGANPPGIGADPTYLSFAPQNKTFEPESVDALELGTKNQFLNGTLNVNLTGFFYNYTDYQVSQIVDRSALNENFDANVWGAEAEILWNVSRKLRFDANFGWLRTKILKNNFSIDVMNRTQGNDEWMVVKPWIQVASNCIAPRALVDRILKHSTTQSANGSRNLPDILSAFCNGRPNYNFRPGSTYANRYGFTYDPAIDAPNSGKGFYAPLEGNELPNAPRWTMNLGLQHREDINGWKVTARADHYIQGKSWARVYNTEIDRLNSWNNTNITLSLNSPNEKLAIQAYIKNLFDKTPITDTFLNSDDSALTLNVFTLDPRIYGLNITSKF